MQEFLNPKSMLTLGVAGIVCSGTGLLEEVPRPWVACLSNALLRRGAIEMWVQVVIALLGVLVLLNYDPIGHRPRVAPNAGHLPADFHAKFGARDFETVFSGSLA